MPPTRFRNLSLKPEYAERIDEWRATQRPIPSSAEAVYIALDRFFAAEGIPPVDPENLK